MSIASVWEFEAHVQDLLDASSDPLDDAVVLAFLEAHPEQLEGFASLIAGVRMLHATPATPVASRSTSTRTRALLWTAAAAAIAWSTWFLSPGEADGELDDMPMFAAAPVSAPPTVVRAELAIAYWTSSEVTESRSAGDAAPVVRTRILVPDRNLVPASGAAPRGIISAATVCSIN